MSDKIIHRITCKTFKHIFDMMSLVYLKQTVGYFMCSPSDYKTTAYFCNVSCLTLVFHCMSRRLQIHFFVAKFVCFLSEPSMTPLVMMFILFSVVCEIVEKTQRI